MPTNAYHPNPPAKQDLLQKAMHLLCWLGVTMLCVAVAIIALFQFDRFRNEATSSYVVIAALAITGITMIMNNRVMDDLYRKYGKQSIWKASMGFALCLAGCGGFAAFAYVLTIQGYHNEFLRKIAILSNLL